MELNIKSKLLNAIGQIYDQSKGCGLKDACFEKLKPHEIPLAEYLQVTPVQAFFFANIFGLNYNGDRASLEALTEFFSCNPMRLLEFSNEIEYLAEAQYIKKEVSRFMKTGTSNAKLLIVDDRIVNAILHNQPLPQLNPSVTTIIDLLEKFYDLGLKRLNEEINTPQLFIHVRKYMDAYAHFGLIQRVHSLHLSIENSFLYFYLIWKTLSGKK
ncbi:MAG: hypothetical protein U5L09_01735 [Bacteroidales bacterium]|nr:hypothetical protein [Bacteroidales bacterium]